MPTIIAVVAAVAGGTSPAAAQPTHARVVPRGLIQIEFAPHYTNYDHRFALGTPGRMDGMAELIGTDLTADTAGSNIFPALRRAEQAIRDIIGDPGYRMNLGRVTTVQDADIRRFPFSLSLGLTDRLTVSATVPIVTTRMQVAFDVDSTTGDHGFNPALQGLGTDAGVAAAAALLAQIDAAVADVEALIAGGAFGCPAAPECAAAQATVDRARDLRANLAIVTGADAGAGSLPSFAPLATSPAGAAITAQIAAVAAELAALGATPITGSLPLPASRLGPDDVNGLLTSTTLGYDAFPLEFIRRSSIGDAEVGLRYGLARTPSFRAVLTAGARLPTGIRDTSAHFLDLGTGDRQMDVRIGVEAVVQPGALGIAFGASYTLQLSDRLLRRVGPPDIPVLPIAQETVVQRNLGDVIAAAAYPTLRLSDAVRVFGSVSYYRKAADAYSGGSLGAGSLFDVAELEKETKMAAVSFGAGLAYASALTPSGGMPIEAGVRFQSAFSGSGGLTPKTNQVHLHLRLFYNLFRPAPPPPDPEPAPEIGLD